MTPKSTLTAIIAAALAAATTLVAGPVVADNHMGEKAGANIVQTAMSTGSHNTLVAAVKAAGLVDAGCILPKSAERKFPSLR